MKKILTAFLLLAGVAALFAEPVKLGKMQDYTIIIPEKATKQEKYSAALLAEYLEKLYKVKVPVVAEPGKTSGSTISVGETVLAKNNGFTEALKPQSYSLKAKGKNLFIRGGFPGPLNGVLSYLQEDLGCRWYAVPYSNIPKCREPGEVRIPELAGKPLTVVPRDYAPPFEIREIMYRYGHDGRPKDEQFFRLAPISYHTDLPTESGGRLNSRLFMHTYTALVNPKKYYEKHPEYFALQNGKRVRQNYQYGAVCYTNPDIPKVMMERIREQIKKEPDACYFSVSVNDGASTQCECEKCAPLFKKHNPSDIQLMLANKVAELLVRENPNARITTLVYDPVKLTVKPHPAVLLFFAPILARYNAINMLVPLSEIGRIDSAIKSYAAEKMNVLFWDYLEYIAAFTPYPNFDQVRDSLCYLADNKVIGYFADCTNGGASMYALKKWVYCQLMWNPRADMDALIAEFISSYFGKAAPEMTEYVALMRKAWQRFIVQHRKESFTMLQYTVEERDKMQQLFESALKKAEDNEVLKGRIAREYICYLTMELKGNAQVYGIEKYKKNYERMKSLMGYVPLNATVRKDFLKRCQAKIEFSGRGREPGDYCANSVTIWKPTVINGFSDYLDDPQSARGKSSRHIGNKPWGIQWNYIKFIDYLVPGKTYVLRLRVRTELKKPRNSGTMFSFMPFHHGGGFKQNRAFDGKFKPEYNDGKYHWIVLGKVKLVQPDSLGMFWMNSLVNRDEAIWYERLEIIPIEDFKEQEIVPDRTILL